MKFLLKIFIVLVLTFCQIGFSQRTNIKFREDNGSTIERIWLSKSKSKEICFDSTNRRVPLYSYGNSVWEVVREKDKKNSCWKESYMDTLGHLVCDYEGIAYKVYRAIQRRKVIERTTIFYDSLGQLKENISGFCKEVNFTRGKKFSETYYKNISNNDTCEGSFWYFKNNYDVRGQIKKNDTTKINYWVTKYNKNFGLVSEMFYRKAGVLGCDIQFSWSGYINTYSQKKLIQRRYFDSTSHLIGDDYGIALELHTYENNRIKCIEWFDADSLPINGKYNHCSKINFVYDAKNRLIEINCSGEEGEYHYADLRDYAWFAGCKLPSSNSKDTSRITIEYKGRKISKVLSYKTYDPTVLQFTQ